MEGRGQIHTPAAISRGKKLAVPIGYEAGWVPESVWTLWKREISNLLAGPRG
jgi:hypothetical protein